MSDYGISDTGFNIKRLDQLLLELNGECKRIFGENFNVAPESPDGQINGVVSESNANLWEIAQASYDAFNPSAATGVTLSNLVQINGISRLPATPTRVTLNLQGNSGTTIPEGSLVSTDEGIRFRTESEITLDGTGKALISAQCLVTGPITVLANTVVNIDTPITGWGSVNNNLDAVTGTDEETDVELRARRQSSVARDAQAVIEAILAAVANIPGVTQTVVLENDTNVTNSNGLPPHSFQVIVVGGVDEEIAQAIWLKKPAGILSFGSTSLDILDSQGLPHIISFSRPVSIDIYVTVTLTAFADYPANGDELIRDAIVKYAEGRLIEGRGFSLADDVIYTRLYTPINSVQGHEIDSLKIGTTSNPAGEVNIPIGADQMSRFLVSNITVIS